VLGLVGEGPQPNFSASPKPRPPSRCGQRSLLRQVYSSRARVNKTFRRQARISTDRKSPGQGVVRAYGSANWQQPQNSPQRALIDTKQVEDQRLIFAFARVQNRKLRGRSKLFIEIPACRSCFV
jgi:hypothetical protein